MRKALLPRISILHVYLQVTTYVLLRVHIKMLQYEFLFVSFEVLNVDVKCKFEWKMVGKIIMQK